VSQTFQQHGIVAAARGDAPPEFDPLFLRRLRLQGDQLLDEQVETVAEVFLRLVVHGQVPQDAAPDRVRVGQRFKLAHPRRRRVGQAGKFDDGVIHQLAGLLVAMRRVVQQPQMRQRDGPIPAQVREHRHVLQQSVVVPHRPLQKVRLFVALPQRHERSGQAQLGERQPLPIGRLARRKTCEPLVIDQRFFQETDRLLVASAIRKDATQQAANQSQLFERFRLVRRIGCDGLRQRLAEPMLGLREVLAFAFQQAQADLPFDLLPRAVRRIAGAIQLLPCFGQDFARAGIVTLIEAEVAELSRAERKIQLDVVFAQGRAGQLAVGPPRVLVRLCRFRIFPDPAPDVTQAHQRVCPFESDLRVLRGLPGKLFVGRRGRLQQLHPKPVRAGQILQHVADPGGHQVDGLLRFLKPAESRLPGLHFPRPRCAGHLAGMVDEHGGGRGGDGRQGHRGGDGRSQLTVAPSPPSRTHVPRVAVGRNGLVAQPSLHVIGQRGGRQVPIHPVAGHGLAADRIQGARHAGIHGARLRGRILGGAPHPLLRIAPLVRPVAGEQPIQDRPQAVDVGQRIDFGVLAQRLFGRHIGGRSQDLAGLSLDPGGSVPTGHGLLLLGQFLRPVQKLGQPPVQHDDFAVLAEHHVGRLQVAMNDAPRVGIGDRVADVDDRLQQPPEFESRRRARPALLVVRFDGVAQRLAVDKPHRVERVSAVLVAGQFVHRHDVGVLQLARDLRLTDEPPQRLVGRLLVGANFLQRHVPAQVLVKRQPDSPQAALILDAGQRVVRDLALRQFGRLRYSHESRHGLQLRQRLLDRRVADAAHHVAELGTGGVAERLPYVALLAVQLAIHQPLHLAALLGANPVAFDEQLGQPLFFVGGPRATEFRELLDVDQFQLQSQHAEQQVLIRIHGRFSLSHEQHAPVRTAAAGFETEAWPADRSGACLLRASAFSLLLLRLDLRQGALRLGVALGGGLAVPLFRFCQIGLDTDAVRVVHAHRIFRIGVALLGCLAVPLDRLVVVLRDLHPVGIAGGQRMLGVGAALSSGLLVPLAGLSEILHDAPAVFVTAGQMVLGLGVALARRRPIRVRRVRLRAGTAVRISFLVPTFQAECLQGLLLIGHDLRQRVQADDAQDFLHRLVHAAHLQTDVVGNAALGQNRQLAEHRRRHEGHAVEVQQQLLDVGLAAQFEQFGSNLADPHLVR